MLKLLQLLFLICGIIFERENVCDDVQSKNWEALEMEMILNPYFYPCKKWIEVKREKGKEWEEILYACKKNEEQLADFLRVRIDEDDWPEEMNCDLWKRFVFGMREAEERSIAVQKAGGMATLTSRDENTKVTVPGDDKSAWQLYRKKLESKDFKSQDIENIEASCIRILKNLSRGTEKGDPIKGLVLGNVQSGKTANMAGLMAMAADWGWNLVIILSGTIENLRKQTQSRLYSDLYNSGNLIWTSLEHLSKNSPLGQRASDLRLEDKSNQRFMTVCLKNKTRLEKLIEWLHADKNQMKRMRILIIDDEADQAGINTSDVYQSSERSTINKLLVNLVYGKTKDGKDDGAAFGAMNYVMYTATPYANCLNECGEGTLYPQDFIHCLGVPNEYIGPEQIFGMADAERDPLNIVRWIPEDEVSVIKEVHDGDSAPDKMPASLRKSVLWFICAVAALRFKGYRKPVSMLVHTSQKQAPHYAVSQLIKKWILTNKNNIVSLCREVYMMEQDFFNKEDFRKAYYEYGKPDTFIWDYPDFDDIVPYIEELTSGVRNIMLDTEGTFNYSKEIHLCIDNCYFNGVNEDGEYVRLAYPEEKLDYAPAFIIVGGNTLSRGLTLEGLVSTYFLRTVGQADTLMQMGRWFGYRPHYELFPRIWLTMKTIEKFEFLTELDKDLRDQIKQMSISDKKPLEFNLALKTSPSLIAITAKNRMQASEVCEMDFTGTDTQLTVYSRDKGVLEDNIKVADDFISSLGQGRLSVASDNAVVWDGIDFGIIKSKFFDYYKVAETSRTFNEIALLEEWVNKCTASGSLKNWSVIAVGKKPSGDIEKNWRISDKFVLGKINRTVRTSTEDTINIGVLSSKQDYIADIDPEKLSSATRAKCKDNRELNKEYRNVRQEAGVADVPLFIIYRIDKDSKAAPRSSRQDLNSPADLIGITMVIPGIRGRMTKRVHIKSMADTTVSFDESEI